MPGKLERCIQKVKASGSKVNPYAVCSKSTGYVVGKGSTKHKKKWVKKDKNKIGESTMIKLTKEDIKKYGLEEEKEFLKEYYYDGYDWVMGKDPDEEIPLGDEQDQSLPEEEISLKDEQEAGEKPSEDYESEYGIGEPISVPKNLLDDIIEFLLDSEVSDQRDDLLMELDNILGEKSDLFRGDIEPEGTGIRRLGRD